MGDGIKKVEQNEIDTVIIQRRSIHARKIYLLEIIKLDDIEVLRPSPKNSFQPNEGKKIIGRRAIKNIKKGSTIFYKDVK